MPEIMNSKIHSMKKCLHSFYNFKFIELTWEIRINPNREELALHREKFYFRAWNISTDHRISKGVRVESKSG